MLLVYCFLFLEPRGLCLNYPRPVFPSTPCREKEACLITAGALPRPVETETARSVAVAVAADAFAMVDVQYVQ